MAAPTVTGGSIPQAQLQQQQQQQPGRAAKVGPDSVVASAISGVRRRSVQNQGLRSPAAKRPVSAPVALQGWLHKQGSEGLMLWKKRWFVLSEYCLFYYKGSYLQINYCKKKKFFANLGQSSVLYSSVPSYRIQYSCSDGKNCSFKD